MKSRWYPAVNSAVVLLKPRSYLSVVNGFVENREPFRILTLIVQIVACTVHNGHLIVQIVAYTVHNGHLVATCTPFATFSLLI